MLVTSIFSFLYTCRRQDVLCYFIMFSTLPKTNFHFSVSFILLFASAFNLDQSKNLSFGKESNDSWWKPYSICSLCPSVRYLSSSLTGNNFLRSQRILFIFHACITLINILEELEVELGLKDC